MDPVVSVIMPVCNGGNFLAAAVDSILSQSLRQLELIVVDDHSQDHAQEQLPAKDPRLRMIKNKGQGVSSAFNTGMIQARGTYIARMDADDVALPHRLERQVDYLGNHPAVSICGACVEIFSARGIEGGNQRYQAWLNACRSPQSIRRELFIESPIPNPTAVFRREALHQLNGYQDPVWPEDYDLYLRADGLGMQMGKPDEILLRWRDHPSRLTRSDERYALERFQAVKAHYLARGRLQDSGKVIIWGAGPSGRLMCDLHIKEDVEISGFLEVHPRRIGGLKRGLPVWSFDDPNALKDAFVVVAVGAAGARDEIRTFLSKQGRIEGSDYLFVA